MPTIPKFTIEKIDKENFKKINTRSEITVLNVKKLQEEKTRLKNEVAKLSQQLAEINQILAKYNELP